MSRKPGREQVGVALFPFLAVLICTMGALIVLLVLLVQQARVDAKVVAGAALGGSAASERERREQLEDAEWKRELLEKSRAEKTQELSHARAKLAHLEEHAQRLASRAKELLDQAQAIDAGNKPADDLAAARAEIARVKADIDRRAKELDEAGKKQKARQDSYALIPYEGKAGTRRRPIYVECTEFGVIVQPEGILLRAEDFTGPLGPGNPLDVTLRAIREHYERTLGPKAGQPYPLLVVRPGGIVAFGAARSAMKAWDDEFGYELISDDKHLDFGETDPALAESLARTVAVARQRQAAMAAMMPRKYQDEPLMSASSPAASTQAAAGGAGNGLGSGGTGTGGGRGFSASPGAAAYGSSMTGSAGKGPGGGAGSGYQGAGGYGGASSPSWPGTSSTAVAQGGGAAGLPGSAGYPGAGSGAGTTGSGGGGAGFGSQNTGQAGMAGQGNLAGASGTGGASGGGTPGSAGGSAGGAAGSSAMASGSSSGGGMSGSPTSASQPGFGVPTFGQGSSPGGSSTGGAAAGSSQAGTTKGGRGNAKSGKNWALPQAKPNAIGVTRPIHITVLPDRIVLAPEQGERRAPLAVPLAPELTPDDVTHFVEAVHKQVDQWGLAVADGYWKPVLRAEVAPGAERHYENLRTALSGSGLDVIRR